MWERIPQHLRCAQRRCQIQLANWLSRKWYCISSEFPLSCVHLFYSAFFFTFLIKSQNKWGISIRSKIEQQKQQCSLFMTIFLHTLSCNCTAASTRYLFSTIIIVCRWCWWWEGWAFQNKIDIEINNPLHTRTHSPSHPPHSQKSHLLHFWCFLLPDFWVSKISHFHVSIQFPGALVTNVRKWHSHPHAAAAALSFNFHIFGLFGLHLHEHTYTFVCILIYT
jgi:hypothetical protein